MFDILIEYEHDRIHRDSVFEYLMKDREEFHENFVDVERNSFDRFDICQMTIENKNNNQTNKILYL